MQKEVVTQEQIRKIREYYQSAELFLVNNSGWRFFRFKLIDGTFKNFCINNKEDFRKLLIKYTPIVAYYSSGCWLNSKNLKGKIKTKTYPIKIYEDAVFDVDAEDLEAARQTTLALIERINLKPNYIIITRRGFHICYYKVANKKEILEKVKDIDFDKKCTENEYGVFSIPLTLNKAGKINIFLTYEHLKNSTISQLQSLQPQIYSYLDANKGSERPSQVDETTALKSCISWESTNSSRSKVSRTEIIPDSIILSFSNQVTSRKNKNYIPILIYDKSLRGLKEEINRLVKKYDLGDIYVFENNRYLCFISIKCVQYRQLQKLLNNSRSITKLQFLKFKKIWFNLSNFMPRGRIDYPTKKFRRISKKHYNFLKDIGFQINEEANEMIGKVPLQMYNTKWEA